MSRAFGISRRARSAPRQYKAAYRQQRQAARLGRLGELVNDSPAPIGGSVRDQRVKFAIIVLAESVHGQPVGQHAGGKLWQQELVDRPVLQISIEKPAVGARRSAPQRQ